jgi:hypothetical protein
MKEEEVHPLSYKYLLKHGFTDYCGVCTKNGEHGSGDVPVPTSNNNKVQIDHKGEVRKDNKWIRMWIEDKGSCNLSTILEGFSRICYAVFYGGGSGLLSMPGDSFKIADSNKEFLQLMAKTTVGKGAVGILNIEKSIEIWF